MEGHRKFEIEGCLGKGGFGEVYLATMHSPGGLTSRVALKVLLEDLGAEADAVRRLRDEGRLLARLNHPAILKVYDMVLLEGRVCLVTEFVDGADLETCCLGEGALGARGQLQAIAQIAAALDEAYETKGFDGLPLRLVHRDIKPTNIRLDRHGQPKLLDFGIARFDAGDREARTATGLIVGSLPYMAPERFMEASQLPASDVFSLGCTLYEGLTEGSRFYGSAQMRKISRLALAPDRYGPFLADRLTSLRERGVDAAVIALLESMLQYRPEDRPLERELAHVLEEAAEDLAGPSLRSWCRRHAWPERTSIGGPLDGRVITEGTLALTRAEVAQPSIQRSPMSTLDQADAAPPAPQPETVFEPMIKAGQRVEETLEAYVNEAAPETPTPAPASATSRRTGGASQERPRSASMQAPEARASMPTEMSITPLSPVGSGTGAPLASGGDEEGGGSAAVWIAVVVGGGLALLALLVLALGGAGALYALGG